MPRAKAGAKGGAKGKKGGDAAQEKAIIAEGASSLMGRACLQMGTEFLFLSLHGACFFLPLMGHPRATQSKSAAARCARP